jgi:adenylate kinase
MAQHIMFVGGVHGVGKTEFSRTVAQALPACHLVASSLIREAGQPIVTGRKQVATVSENQDALVQALQKYQSFTKPILLDGHFCLLTSDIHIQDVPFTTFHHVAPKAALVVVDAPLAIAERLARRDGNAPPTDFIAEFQNRELEHAVRVCHRLGIPLFIHNASHHLDVAINFLRDHTS